MSGLPARKPTKPSRVFAQTIRRLDGALHLVTFEMDNAVDARRFRDEVVPGHAATTDPHHYNVLGLMADACYQQWVAYEQTLLEQLHAMQSYDGARHQT